MSQGRYASEDEVRRIIRLLASTELSMSEISERIGRSQSVVNRVNARFAVRIYRGKRWEVAPAYRIHPKKR